MKFWIYLKLSQKSAQRTQNSNIDFKNESNFFMLTSKKSQEKNSFLKCLVMSKVIYFVIWIVSTLLLEKISDSEKL